MKLHAAHCCAATILLALLLQSGLFAREYDVQSVPNPRSTGGFLADPEDILDQAEKDAVDELLIALEQETSVEFAIVMLPGIGAKVPKDFAVELFNTWGIGKAGKDNGLLLLFVMESRSWEFETGYGLEGVLPDAVLKRIGEQSIPVHFRRGDYGQGVLATAQSVAAILRQNQSEVSLTNEERARFKQIEEQKRQEKLLLGETYAVKRTLRLIALFGVFFWSGAFLARFLWNRKHPESLCSVRLLFFLAAVPFLLVCLYLFRTGPVFHFIEVFGLFVYRAFGVFLLSSAYLYANAVFLVLRLQRTGRLKSRLASQTLSLHQQYNAWKTDHGSSWLYFLILPAGAAYSIYLTRTLNRLRNEPRPCAKCSGTRRKLDERLDDVHLEKGQVVEETIGSMDYDVWYCEACEDALVEAYDRSSSYTRCKSCARKTYKHARSETITAATYSSSGRGVSIYECKNCGLTHRELYTIAQLTRSSSSSSSYRSSSSSGYRSSSSSGSSSSGSSRSSGSFGGGSSGGGGAGGKW